MKPSDQKGFPIGLYSGSCGKQEMLESSIREMKRQKMQITVVDSQEELKSLRSGLEPDEPGQ